MQCFKKKEYDFILKWFLNIKHLIVGFLVLDCFFKLKGELTSAQGSEHLNISQQIKGVRALLKY